MDRSPAPRSTAAAGPDGALTRARALADPTRAEIHRLLSAAADGLTIAELATSVGVHRTAVGQHLALLESAGLVERSVRPPAGRGRPVSAFRAVDDDPYRALAGWLAEAVRTRRSAREIGHDVGGRLATGATHDDRRVERDDPMGIDTGATHTTDEAIDTVVHEAARLGFAPVVRHRRSGRGLVDVILQRCPYAELAAVDPATACELHLGLAEGVAACTGAVTVDGLKITDPRRGGCRLTLRTFDRA